MKHFSLTVIIFVLIIPLLAIASASPDIFMPGKVSGGHAEIAGKCLECHEPWNGALDQKCIDCHSRGKAKIDPSTHGLECKACHLEHGGRNATVIYFDHHRVGYVVTTGHAKLKCRDCHPTNYLSDPSPSCRDCHSIGDSRGANMSEHIEVFGSACLNCHRNGKGSLENFDHSKVGYELVKGHKELSCKECHISTYSRVITSACVECHSNSGASPGINMDRHITDFGRACLECHGKGGFDLGSFDHSKTGYTIDHHHYSLSCKDCHSKGFSKEPTCDAPGCHGEGKMYREHVEHGIFDYGLYSCLECHRSKDSEKEFKKRKKKEEEHGQRGFD
jgi:hypothetical protein